MIGAGLTAVGTALSAPVWVTAIGVVAVGTVLTWGVGKAYENTVPLRTRERIDEGIRDTWNVTSKATLWGLVFG